MAFIRYCFYNVADRQDFIITLYQFLNNEMVLTFQYFITTHNMFANLVFIGLLLSWLYYQMTSTRIFSSHFFIL